MTLDMLSRQDMLNVIKILHFYLGLEDAAQRKINELNIHLDNKEKEAKNKNSSSLFFLLFFGFIMIGPIMFSVFMIGLGLMSFVTDLGWADTLAKILGLLAIGAIVVIIKCFKKQIKQYKNKDDFAQNEFQEYKASVYAYFPYYEGLKKEYRNKILTLKKDFNIQDELCYSDMCAYVIRILQSNATVSLNKAIQDFIEIEYKESMLDELRKQNSQIAEIKKQNQEYYDNVIDKMNDIRNIEQQKLETINYIRYEI